MVLKQGPNKHIIGSCKIQNFQFEGETNRNLTIWANLLYARPIESNQIYSTIPLHFG